MPAKPATLGSAQDRGVWIRADCGLQVSFQPRQDVRGDADGPSTGLGLGRPQAELATDVVGGALNEDPSVQEVDIAAFKTQNLPQGEMTPRRQLHGNPPWFGHGRRQGIDFGDGQHRPFGGSLLGSPLYYAEIPADELIGHRSGQEAAQQPVGLGRGDRIHPSQRGGQTESCTAPSPIDLDQMWRSSRMTTWPLGDSPLAKSCSPLASISGPNSASSSTRKPRCS